MPAWAYLESEHFDVRQRSVVHLLDGLDVIIEVGGGKRPINQFVSGRLVFHVEPYEEYVNGKDDRENDIVHIKKCVQDLNEDDLYKLTQKPYGLVVFGLDYDLCPTLHQLWDKARVTVIESTTDLAYHRNLLDSIAQAKKPYLDYEIIIRGYVHDSAIDSWPPRTHRRILVYNKL